MRRPRSAAFTLIELLVAIAIMAVLTLIALPAINRFKNNSRVVGASRTVQSVFQRTRQAAVTTNRPHRLFVFLESGPTGLPVYGMKAYRDDGAAATPRYVPSDVSVLLPEGVFLDLEDSNVIVLAGPPAEDLAGVPANEGIFIAPDGQVSLGGGTDVAQARDTGGFSLYDTTQGYRLVTGQILADIVVYDQNSPSYGFMDISPLTGKVQFAVVNYDVTAGTGGGGADFVSATGGPVRTKIANKNRTLIDLGTFTRTSDQAAAVDGASIQF